MPRRIFVVFLFAVFLMGCAGASTKAATEIIVEASDFAYQPVSITIPAGAPVRIMLHNAGAVEHDFVVEKISVTDVEVSNSDPAEHHMGGQDANYDLHFFAKAGDKETLQFTALEPGTYEVFCSIQGHKEAGMVATLIVENQEQISFL